MKYEVSSWSCETCHVVVVVQHPDTMVLGAGVQCPWCRGQLRYPHAAEQRGESFSDRLERLAMERLEATRARVEAMMKWLPAKPSRLGLRLTNHRRSST